MIAIIFEVEPAPGQRNAYLAQAAELRPILEKMDGFISVERFESLTKPGKLLSVSFWRDEESIARWRQNEEHRLRQAMGRSGMFADYRLRVAAVIRDYGLNDRAEAPEDSLSAL